MPWCSLAAMWKAILLPGLVRISLSLLQVLFRWRVENSWGADHGEKGYDIMTDPWFDQFMYEVVVHKKHLTKKLVDLYNTEPIGLPPWDPMGSLAI